MERELSRVWQLYQRTVVLANHQRRASLRGGRGGAARAASSLPTTASGSLAEGLAVCQLASHFFRQCLLYVTFEVVEPLWRTLEESVQSARSLDEVGRRPGVAMFE